MILITSTNSSPLNKPVYAMGCLLISSCKDTQPVCVIDGKEKNRRYDNRCLMKFDQCLMRTSE